MSIADLAEYRGVKRYINVINELFVYFVKSDEFAIKNAADRAEVVDSVEELKELLESNIVK